MDKATLLKKMILSQYKSIREFSKAVNIPNSTIVSALNKGELGIDGMAAGKVIKICDTLNIDIKTFQPLKNNTAAQMTTLPTAENKYKRITDTLDTMNDEGVEKVEQYADDLASSGKYKKLCGSEVLRRKEQA